MKLPCCECGKKRERCRLVVKLADGTPLFVCPRCWNLYDYVKFFFNPVPVVN